MRLQPTSASLEFERCDDDLIDSGSGSKVVVNFRIANVRSCVES
jgi:hypothetical protein